MAYTVKKFTILSFIQLFLFSHLSFSGTTEILRNILENSERDTPNEFGLVQTFPHVVAHLIVEYVPMEHSISYNRWGLYPQPDIQFVRSFEHEKLGIGWKDPNGITYFENVPTDENGNPIEMSFTHASDYCKNLIDIMGNPIEGRLPTLFELDWVAHSDAKKVFPFIGSPQMQGKRILTSWNFAMSVDPLHPNPQPTAPIPLLPPYSETSGITWCVTDRIFQ